MQFKIDENLPIEIVELLNDAGHDAKTVNNQQLQGAKDHLLINVCKSEHRILITLDIDFSEWRDVFGKFESRQWERTGRGSSNISPIHSAALPQSK